MDDEDDAAFIVCSRKSRKFEKLIAKYSEQPDPLDGGTAVEDPNWVDRCIKANKVTFTRTAPTKSKTSANSSVYVLHEAPPRYALMLTNAFPSGEMHIHQRRSSISSSLSPRRSRFTFLTRIVVLHQHSITSLSATYGSQSMLSFVSPNIYLSLFSARQVPLG